MSHAYIVWNVYWMIVMYMHIMLRVMTDVINKYIYLLILSITLIDRHHSMVSAALSIPMVRFTYTDVHGYCVNAIKVSPLR